MLSLYPTESASQLDSVFCKSFNVLSKSLRYNNLCARFIDIIQASTVRAP